ncbi:hypothetical protein [Micromonospora sp. DT47]|uniref:hypothetical protein n=1 Tax=Micromonospora sp. DT47 TaxID=3393431 RepID=UPI003CE7349C
MPRDFITRGGVAYVDQQLRTWGSPRFERSATWPFARLRVTGQAIVVSSIFGEFRLTQTNLVSISRVRHIPVLADGFMFEARGHQEMVIFWALRARKVLDELRRHEWVVDNG